MSFGNILALVSFSLLHYDSHLASSCPKSLTLWKHLNRALFLLNWKCSSFQNDLSLQHSPKFSQNSLSKVANLNVMREGNWINGGSLMVVLQELCSGMSETLLLDYLFSFLTLRCIEKSNLKFVWAGFCLPSPNSCVEILTPSTSRWYLEIRSFKR